MIHVSHLTKCYGGKKALDDVSFSVSEGEVVGLLGLNGAGKSTTMNILTGYICATYGSVSIDGHDITNESKLAKSVIGYLPEQPSFYPEMRVDEHLDFICDMKGVTKNKQEREKHISGICGRVGIEDMRKRMIKNLSKGYKQRVGFAQAMIGNPKALILDEPTVGLDPSQIIEIRKLIKDSCKQSTVIVSSHILSEIQTICSRVIVLNNGRVIADGSPENLTARTGSTNKLKIRVLGQPEKVAAALERVNNVHAVQILAQTEPGAYDYEITGNEKSDIRADIFRALAKEDLPMLSTYGGDLSLEAVFLGLIGGTHEPESEGDKI